jgi:hypothetical protein
VEETLARSRWVVTVSGDHDLAEIADELAARGFTDMQLLDKIGLITGVADDEVVDDVRGISGVSDVYREGEFKVGPPDAPIS